MASICTATCEELVEWLAKYRELVPIFLLFNFYLTSRDCLDNEMVNGLI